MGSYIKEITDRADALVNALSNIEQMIAIQQALQEENIPVYEDPFVPDAEEQEELDNIMKENNVYKDGGDTENVELPEIVVTPDWELNKKLRLTYPDKDLRQQLLKASQAVEDDYDYMFGYDQYMPTNQPLINLLQLHNYAAPHISVYAGGNDDTMERTDNEGNIHTIGRAHTDRNSDTFWDDTYDGYTVNRWNDFGIHVDPQLWDKSGRNAWNDLVSEYAHPYNFTHMPFRYHYQPYFENEEDYDELYYTPYSNEYMTHDIIEPVIKRNVAESIDSLDFDYINKQIRLNEKDISNKDLTKFQKKKAKENLKSIRKVLKIMKEHHIPEKTENGAFTSMYDEDAGEEVYADGGLISIYDKPIEELALKRSKNATQPYSNYFDAIDFVKNPISELKYAFDKGVSNCTLTASQFFDPRKPIVNSRTIINYPHVSGFYQVDENHVIPGSLVISSEPGKSDSLDSDNKYHAMVLSGYANNNYTFPFLGKVYNIKKGEPLVNYSRGKRTPENYVKNIPLSAYLDQSNGKTQIRYYRPYNNGLKAKLLPEITVTPKYNYWIDKNKFKHVSNR